MVAASSGLRAQQMLPPIHGKTVVAYSEAELSKMLTGSVEKPGRVPMRRSRTAVADEVVWKTVRDEKDDRGQRHVFMRQYLRGEAGDVELLGSEVGLHYGRDGRLFAAGGAQFTDVEVTNSLRFAAEEAQGRALRVMAKSRPSLAAKTALASGTPRRMIEGHPELLLVPVAEGKFRYAYRVAAADEGNAAHRVVIDGDNEELLSDVGANPGSTCGPTGYPNQAGAFGTPVRPDVPTRGLVVNVSPIGDYPYEAWAYFYPDVAVYQENVDWSPTSPYQCMPGRAYPSFTLFPVHPDSAHWYFGSFDDSESRWHGSAAGDAMYKTMLAVEAFGELGRHGWDGHYGRFDIVVESSLVPYSCGDACASFVFQPGGDARVPGPAVTVSTTPSNAPLYNITASLDQIAHEWGHGMIFTSANFDRSQDVGVQLHEGYADVFGQFAEKVIEPSGAGVERSSDWTLGEDASKSGQYAFSSTIDDGSSHTYGNLSLNIMLHAADTPASSGHERGNMLNVVYYLLSEGGPNPICGRVSNCSVTVATGLGPSQAGKVMLNAVQFYIPSNAQWSDLGLYTSWAAFDMYSQCHTAPFNNATDKQDLARKAFEAIGYGTAAAYRTCP
jgi:hypothetical protein